MSKSQQKSNKEIRKPKAVKTAVTAPTVTPLGTSPALLPRKRK